MMKLKLYKKIAGRLELVDFGVFTQLEKYINAGYTVEINENEDRQQVYSVVKRQFDALYNTLDDANKAKVQDLYNNIFDQSIEERLSMLKAHVATHCRPRKIHTVPRHKKVSLWTKIKTFAQSLVPQPAYAYSC